MFSVLIPSHNHILYLPEAILSAMEQRLVGEILILDDGSTDGSRDLVRDVAGRHASLVRDITPDPAVNRGAHAALNGLVSAARFDWIAILNSDDRFAPGRFEAVRNRLRLDDFDFCFGDIAILDATSTVRSRKRAFRDPQFAFPPEERLLATDRRGLFARLLCQNYMATTSNMVFTRKLWARVGGFRAFRYVHDWDFALRCTYLGQPAYIPECLTCYRRHEANTIKEARARQDEEVSELFEALEHDLGNAVFDGLRPYLDANEYLRNGGHA